ncbi:hypothetical protein DB88DRAFT_501505 [Papiliotrema laurentii]|uniref:Uncharacterized protein n=1 Tax=Papiliotrema laurentii TaxID=5418 RepID=A0AAD9CU69_PAPLA|nr:hypothetical protein DB88DRAFT_501505 [Papiliotrema laurentii]
MSSLRSSTSSSAASTPTKKIMPSTPSPTITPLHDPAHRATVLPQAKPLGAINPNPVVPGQGANPSLPADKAAGLGQKALLAKKFAKANKPTISPTDAMQSPCTAKLAGAKQKHFGKGKPASLAKSFLAIRDVSGASTTSNASRRDF